MVTEERIERLIEQYAVYAAADEAFLPVFERLETELAKVRSKSSALDRARAIAAGQKEMGFNKVAA